MQRYLKYPFRSWWLVIELDSYWHQVVELMRYSRQETPFEFISRQYEITPSLNSVGYCTRRLLIWLWIRPHSCSLVGTTPSYDHSWRTVTSSVVSTARTGSSGSGSNLFKFKRRKFVFHSRITIDSEDGPGRWCGIGIWGKVSINFKVGIMSFYFLHRQNLHSFIFI